MMFHEKEKIRSINCKGVTRSHEQMSLCEMPFGHGVCTLARGAGTGGEWRRERVCGTQKAHAEMLKRQGRASQGSADGGGLGLGGEGAGPGGGGPGGVQPAQ